MAVHSLSTSTIPSNVMNIIRLLRYSCSWFPQAVLPPTVLQSFSQLFFSQPTLPYYRNLLPYLVAALVSALAADVEVHGGEEGDVLLPHVWLQGLLRDRLEIRYLMLAPIKKGDKLKRCDIRDTQCSVWRLYYTKRMCCRESSGIDRNREIHYWRSP